LHHVTSNPTYSPPLPSPPLPSPTHISNGALLATNTINFIFAKQVMGICAPTQSIFPRRLGGGREGGREIGRGKY